MASNGGLRQRAAELAGRDPADTTASQEPYVDEPVDLPEVTAPDGIDADPERVPVQVAISRVMRDLGKIGKGDRFDGGSAGRFNFRGVDRVVNAVAPLLRKHGVVVVPELAAVEYRDVARSSGSGRNHECIVTMRYHWYGPDGGHITATTQGESLDTSDKGTAKAQAVAWRVCLIQTLAIPTGDPDPDSVLIERGETRFDPVAYRDEALNPGTSSRRLDQMLNDFKRLGHGSEIVRNEHGEDEKLGNLVWRLKRERAQPAQQPADPEQAWSDVDVAKGPQE